MAESGPSVVVWELSLMGDEACVPSLRSRVGSDGTVLIWLELGLRMSSSSPLVAVLRSIESGCSVCCARGCSVMMSCTAESVAELVEPGVERPVGAASSPLISPLTEAEDREMPSFKDQKVTLGNERSVAILVHPHPALLAASHWVERKVILKCF